MMQIILPNINQLIIIDKNAHVMLRITFTKNQTLNLSANSIFKQRDQLYLFLILNLHLILRRTLCELRDCVIYSVTSLRTCDVIIQTYTIHMLGSIFVHSTNRHSTFIRTIVIGAYLYIVQIC